MQAVVACLCAAWCSSCRAYRATFDAVAMQFPDVAFVWVDIEEETAVVDGLDVEDFPTLLVAAEGGARFFGPLMPQPEVLARIVRAHVDPGDTLPDAALAAVVRRLRVALRQDP